jgi:3',5'-cyclic-AMP phosphodiesterase
MTFRIVQVSDTHLSATKPFFVANFRRVCEGIARDAPDLVINTGDLSLNGADDDDDLAEARRQHTMLPVPVRFIPGNHDVGDNQDVPGAHGGALTALRRDRYLRHFGSDWWRMDVQGWRIIGVNAQLFGSDLGAAEDQERFLRQAAATTGDRAVALFVHKPLFDQRLDEDVVGGRFLNPASRARLLSSLDPVSPALVASGHVHQYRAGTAGGASHVWAPSTAYFIPDSRQPRYGLKEVGYVIHELHENGTHRTRFAAAAGTTNLCITDFPDAYGPMG